LASGSVDDGVAVAHEHRERDAYADVAGRPRHLARLGDGVGGVEARVMRHHRARAAARRAAEGGERAEVGIDRRHRRQPQQPQLQRLVGAAERGRRQRPAMIVCIGKRGQGEAARPRSGARPDVGDEPVAQRDIDRAVALAAES